MKVTTTGRGFQIVEFTDHNGAPCSLQQSSAALYAKPGSSFVWFGPNNADPKIMASQTPAGGTGWVPYPIPENVLLTTRTHLDRKTVKKLISYLQNWLECGEFKKTRSSIRP
jgi:hypothetical protein